MKKEFELFNDKIEHTIAGNSKKEQERTYIQLPRRNISQPFNSLPTQQPLNLLQQNEPNLESESKQVNGQPQITSNSKAQELITPYVASKESPKMDMDNLFKKKKIYLNQDISNNNHQQTMEILNNASSPKVLSALNGNPKPIEPSKTILSIKAEATPR